MNSICFSCKGNIAYGDPLGVPWVSRRFQVGIQYRKGCGHPLIYHRGLPLAPESVPEPINLGVGEAKGLPLAPESVPEPINLGVREGAML